VVTRRRAAVLAVVTVGATVAAVAGVRAGYDPASVVFVAAMAPLLAWYLGGLHA
jgi:hypothetical protein